LAEVSCETDETTTGEAKACGLANSIVKAGTTVASIDDLRRILLLEFYLNFIYSQL